MFASPWWKTSNVFARLPAESAVSLKAASKRCTTWFLSPTGVRHDPEKHVLGLDPWMETVFGSDHAWLSWLIIMSPAGFLGHGRTPESGYCGARHCWRRSRPPYRSAESHLVGALRTQRARRRRHRALQSEKTRSRSPGHRLG